MTTLKLNDSLICCFCETISPAEIEWCDTCDEYKGLMTLADFNRYYGEDK